MRHIKLVIEDVKFNQMEKVKERAEKELGEKISWEDFVFKQVCGK